jgi:hypothetical protein
LFRYPAIFLLTTFLSLGSNCFERIHLAEVNAALARIPVPKLASRVPLKRVPMKPPIHDPATCAICMVLHAPVATQTWAMPALGLTTLAGNVVSESFLSISVQPISYQHCRGPPAV